ncbi:hypothetical protein KEM55_003502 [Ascosphaera atra]|nr:hypothetical protein KEM55_003502 [Ascosphaera atra]
MPSATASPSQSGCRRHASSSRSRGRLFNITPGTGSAAASAGVSRVSRPAPVAPVASPAPPRVAAVGPSAPADVPTGASLVGGSGGPAVWHGEQQLHVFRLPATVNGQAAAPLELDERDERVVRFLEEYGESAFCADWRGHAHELCSAQELNAVLYQVSAPVSATLCTRCQGERGTFMTCRYGPGGCGSCRFQHNGATCALPTVEEDNLFRENERVRKTWIGRLE